MMQLAFDIGNSALKMGLYNGSKLVRSERAGLSSSETTALIENVVTRETVAWASIASVVPNAAHHVVQVLESHGVPIQMVHHAVRLPFRIAYQTPETLGADRIAAAAGAWLRHGHPGRRGVVAVDAGTAVTCEVVTKDGTYLGGTIAPGPALMQRALNTETAQLPDVPLDVPETPIGRTTREAIQAGVLLGFIDSVQGMLRRISEQLGESPAVVVTGGWGPSLRGHLERIDAFEPNLVLEGARAIGEMNYEGDLSSASQKRR